MSKEILVDLNPDRISGIQLEVIQDIVRLCIVHDIKPEAPLYFVDRKVERSCIAGIGAVELVPLIAVLHGNARSTYRSGKSWIQIQWIGIVLGKRNILTVAWSRITSYNVCYTKLLRVKI